MELKTGFLVVILIVGCLGVPTPDDDLSIFFEDHDSRIIGGIESAPGSHPHMVAFTIGFWLRTLLCGGSLLSQRTVLTAAHCLDGQIAGGSLASSLRVIVGTNRWNRDGEIYRIARNVTHPHYEIRPIKNDVALLITAEDVVLSARVQTLPLTFDFIGEGVAARVAGWGRTRLNGGASAVLRELQTVTIDGDSCVVRADQAALDLNMRPPPVDPQIEVCTLHSAGVGNCHGDSGSPITRLSDGAQFGVVSWAFPCARGAPDVYVRLSAYRAWLEASIV
ncbi:unnamed protein product [Chrysodeixis includens]|uniref:Peptidase S1 domain-containing protein n=1 Tax=Chrysodeixis includens TaxID=689277 RepID=A0A9P0C303_CHRIL|nr:unnamed protein product [Chrysodeixis includens]